MQEQDVLYQQLNTAIRDAYRTPEKLAYMLRSQCSKRLNEITLARNMIDIVAEVIETAESEGWFEQLVVGAGKHNPGNQKLQVVAQMLSLAPSVTTTIQPEAIISQTHPFIGVAQFLTRLAEAEARICRIDTPQSQGTGFLLGPDAIITNYHVVQQLIEPSSQSYDPGEVRLFFDHKKLANGVIVPGKLVKLARDWRIDISLPSPLDAQSHHITQMPSPSELDYAILHLAIPIGNEELHGKGKPNARRRGWFDLSSLVHSSIKRSLQSKESLLILQHPTHFPLMLAWESNAIIHANTNMTRVRYSTDTDCGSSGSPCFNREVELVALHRAGTRNMKGPDAFNEGIPIVAIRNLLLERGFHDIVGHGNPE